MTEEIIRVFVTGATGTVGAYVVSELIRAGRYAVSFAYRSEASLEKLRQRLRYDGLEAQFDTLYGYKVDLEVKQELVAPFSAVDVVVHCAARVDLGNTNKTRLIRDNIEMTAAVIAAAKEAGVKRLVHLSSIATLGQSTEEGGMVNESCLLSSLSGQSPYAIAKFYAEAEVWKAIHNGMNAIILNPAVVLGSGAWESGSPSIFRRIAQGSVFYPCGTTGYVAAVDVARAVERVIDSPVCGDQFVLCSDNLSYGELMRTCAESLGVSAPKYRLGKSILTGGAKGLDLLAALGIRGSLSGSLLRTLAGTTRYDGSKFAEQFGFRYTTPLKESIDQCAKEYKNR